MNNKKYNSSIRHSVKTFNYFRMNYIIQFLLIGLMSTIINKVESVNVMRKFVERYSRDDGMNIIDSNQHILKVSNDILHDSEFLLVCKGTYDGLPVAIKMYSVDVLFDDEIKIYNALNDVDAESHGIPNVYYYGNVFKLKSLHGIAMSLFDETLEQRYKNQSTGISKPFSDFSVLLIFKQAVKTLKYLHLKRVWHNDIKPQNLFLRKTDVFIADFNIATLNETQGDGYTYEYTSSNRFANVDRCAMDDLESLIFSMWHVAGFDFSEPYGSLLLKQKKKNKAESWVKEICKRFKLKITQVVFTDICINEMLSGEKVPKYDRILQLLSNAIDEVTQITKQTKFEWLPITPKKPSQECAVL